MKWYTWIFLLIMLLLVAFVITTYKNWTYKQLDEEYLSSPEEFWITSLKKNTPEQYIRFNRGVFSDLGEAIAASSNTKFEIPCSSSKTYFRSDLLKQIAYLNSYENTVSVSNTFKIYGGNLCASTLPNTTLINMDYLSKVQGPLIGYGLILPPKSSITFHLSDKPPFPFFMSEGVLTVSQDNTNSSIDGVYNIIGQDITQIFNIDNFMTDVTFKFNGTILSLVNNGSERYYGFIMFKAIPKLQEHSRIGGGISVPIYT